MTKTLFSKMLVGAALASIVSVPLVASPRLSPAEQMNKALAGRVAGKPVHCIDPRLNSDTKVIDKTAIIYGSGRTVYLQEPTNPQSLDDDDILVTQLRGTGQLCSIDTIRLHDRSTGFYRGFVGLRDFVPYTRVASN